MNREYHKWWSPSLHREMELLIFGHAGTPLLVFPTSMGRFYEYESRDMIGVIAGRYETGQVQAFCVDSVDKESWYNRHVHPARRAARHNDYDRYLWSEVAPLIRAKNGSGQLVTTGCSFGGYHALNFALRHPDIVTGMVSMSGAFDIHQFVQGYYDDNCYFNCPADFLPNLSDGHLLDLIRRQRIVLGTSDWDICLGQNRHMHEIMDRRQIPHWFDIWGNHMKHDWPLWQQMAIKFLQ